jgi:hypothetical protein
MQDGMAQESMGQIVDRTKERLGTTDIGVIAARRRLLRAARALQESGIAPPGAEHAEAYRYRSVAVTLPKSESAAWVEGVREYVKAQPGVNLTQA